MTRLPKTLLVACLALAAVALPQTSPASASDSGVRTPRLADDSPGAVSVPFEIPVRLSSATRDPVHYEIAVEGFDLDPSPLAGNRIGSLDLLSASGNFGDKAIFSNGPGTDGVRTWTLDWQLSGENEPIVATVEDDFGLDSEGGRIPAPGTTLIGFTMPGNYHGFPISGLDFRFNENLHGIPSPGVGAVNPGSRGSFVLRSRIESTVPASVDVATAFARIGLPALKTTLRVKADRKRVRPGHKVGFWLSTANGTGDVVTVRLGKRVLRKVEVGGGSTYFTWRAERRLRGRKVVVRFKPANGPVFKVPLRITRR